VKTNGVAQFRFQDPSGSLQTVSGGTNALNIRDGEWHHLVGVYSFTTTNATLYVDGVAEATGTITNWNPSAASTFAFGFLPPPPNAPFTLDEARLYNVALSSNDVLQLPNIYYDPDGDGLSNLQENQYGTNPNSADTDSDGLPDAWEIAHNLDPTSASGDNGSSGDPDGDGYTNSQEYTNHTDPNDYYNGVLPTLVIVSGNNQVGLTNSVLTDPLVLDVQNGSSQSLSNSPVAFTTSGGVQISTNSSGPWYSSMNLRTHSAISVYALLPSSPGTVGVTATATSGSSSTYTTMSGTATGITCIEEAMCAVQERYQVALSTNVTWPDRTYPTPASPGLYPSNSFYCADISSNGVAAVTNLIQAIANKVSNNDFLTHFVAQIDGQSNVLVHSASPLTNTVAGVTVIGIGDMPMPTNFTCGANTATLGELTAYIGQLNSFLVAATQAGTNGVGSSKEYRQGLSVGASTCALAKQAAIDCWNNGATCGGGMNGVWTNTSNGIFVEEFTGHPSPFPGPSAEAALYAVRGKVSADLSGYGTNGLAQVHLRLVPMANGVSNDPPVTPADSTWRSYQSVTPGTAWLSDVLPTGAGTNGYVPTFTLDCPTNQGTRFAGWTLGGQVATVTPIWTNNISGTCAECTMGLFRIIGPDKLCVGTTAALTTAGGSATGWSSGNPTVATVNGSGVVTGLTASASIGDVVITATNTLGCLATWGMTVVGVGELKADEGNALYGPTNVVAWATNGVVTVTAKSQPQLAASQLPTCWSLTGGDGTNALFRTITKTNAVFTLLTASAGSSVSNLWIAPVRVDLDAGRNEAEEENPGVYVSVNWGDNDGDGWSPTNQTPPDATYTGDKDDPEIVGGDTTFRSFTLGVQPSGVGGTVKLTFPAKMKVWGTNTKKSGGVSSQILSGSNLVVSSSPQTLYIEGVLGSDLLRDVELNAEHVPNGGTPIGSVDIVRLTVFEVELTGIFSGPQQSDNDARHSALNFSSDTNGIISWDDPDTNCMYFANCLEVQGTVKPSGVTNQVSFTFARLVWGKGWSRNTTNDAWTVQNNSTPWQNDDLTESDEDKTVSPSNHIYQIDGPGFAVKLISEGWGPYMAQVADLMDVTAVIFEGHTYQCSDFYKWHTKTYLKPKNATELTRDIGSLQEVGGGWIAVPSSP
jgi:hypothetical protein